MRDLEAYIFCNIKLTLPPPNFCTTAIFYGFSLAACSDAPASKPSDKLKLFQQVDFQVLAPRYNLLALLLKM